MVEPKQTPKGDGAEHSKTSKQSTMVRVLFFLSVSGNLLTIFSSLVLSSTTSEHSTEHMTFQPPEQEGKVRLKRQVTHPFEMTHFLSHIPKTGAEYAALELAKLLAATIPLPGEKTIHQIQSDQNLYNATLSEDPEFNASDIDWLYFDKNSRDHDHENPNSLAYAPPFICNQGKLQPKYVSPYHFGTTIVGRKNNLKFRCSLIVSEIPWHNKAPNIYTITREPLSHFVSQYFHCTDSSHSHKRPNMTSLDDWLKAYVDLAKSLPLESRPPYTHYWNNPKAQELFQHYNCFNPIDSESDYVKFPARVDGKRKNPRLVLPENYTYPYYPRSMGKQPDQPPRDKETRQIDKALFDDLKKRFRVIGDMSQMIRTICAIFIDFTEGVYIPKPCDCTHVDTKTTNDEDLPSVFKVPNLYNTHPTLKYRSNRWYNRPYLELGYNRTKHAHGVKTNGTHFVKDGLTDSQKDQITRHLRSLDVVLYNVSRAVFDAQVEEMENAYGIKICEGNFNRDSEMDWVDPRSRQQPRS